MTTDRIELNPAVLQGKPDLVDAYPRLTRDDIQAVNRDGAGF